MSRSGFKRAARPAAVIPPALPPTITIRVRPRKFVGILARQLKLNFQGPHTSLDLTPRLELRLQARHGLIRYCAVDDPMVETEREIDHRTDRYSIVDDYRPFLDSSYAKDCYLGLINDRSSK